MTEWYYYDGGPNDHDGACVCRAISVVANIPFNSLLGVLAAPETSRDDISRRQLFLYRLGYVWHAGPKKIRDLTGGRFFGMILPHEGLSAQNPRAHAVAIIDGVVYDKYQPWFDVVYCYCTKGLK